MRKFHLQILALLLLLVFSQKLGLRLWMHHWIHESKLINVSSHPDSEKIQFNCDCNEDAMMPLAKSSTIAAPVPSQECIVLSENYHRFIPTCQKLFCSLKGPPALSI